MPLPELAPRESRVKGLVTACLRNAKKVIAGSSLEGEGAMSGLEELREGGIHAKNVG